jgi:hypothetical protein
VPSNGCSQTSFEGELKQLPFECRSSEMKIEIAPARPYARGLSTDTFEFNAEHLSELISSLLTTATASSGSHARSGIKRRVCCRVKRSAEIDASHPMEG